MIGLLAAIATVAATAAAAAPREASRSVVVYGQRIHYVEADAGPPVILLHAVGPDLSDWRANIAQLARHHRIIAFDTIGWGASDKPAIDYRSSTLVDFLGGRGRAGDYLMTSVG